MPVLPPTIPGLTYKGFIGSGGFADVYLYESASPVRNVAVKVLHDKNLSQQWVRRFAVEANTMAALEHPYIVRVHSSGLTADGRPYIEMAYYPDESLAQAVAKEPLPVAEVLRIGVQLASAIAAAHQVGLMHRDIKPANVLVDKFGDPALTDFGIASHIHEADPNDSSLSVPWAPPEAIFANAPLDRRCDIYSLAATMWHLLVGHSPFELPGGDNKPTSMMVRVRDLTAPSTGRGDVPESLERLLRQALAKDPRLRPSTADDFARALNAIEEELRLRPTPFKVARQAVSRSAAPNSGAAQANLTRARPASSSGQLGPLSPGGPGGPGSPGGPSGQVGPFEDGTRQRGLSVAPQPSPQPAPPPIAAVVRTPGSAAVIEDATRLRSAAVVEPPVAAAPEEPANWSRRVVLGVIVVLVVAGAIGAWVWFGPEPTPEPPPLPTPTYSSDVGLGRVDTWPGTPVITSKLDNNQVTFKWIYNNSDPSDYYLVTAPDGTQQRLEDPTFTVGYEGQSVCIGVLVRRASGGYATTDNPTEGCYP